MEDQTINSNLCIIILAGGEGKRLEKMTGTKTPKQFNKKIINKRHSLFQRTIQNVRKMDENVHIVISGNTKHSEHIYSQIEALKLQNYTIILEPLFSNTGPSVTMATILAKRMNFQKILILPSDHFITKNSEYVKFLNIITAQNTDEIILVGHKITSKTDTCQFGIIRTDNKKTKSLKAQSLKKVMSFHEKPSLEALQNLKINKETGLYINGGILFGKTDTFLKTIQEANEDLFFASHITANALDLSFDKKRVASPTLQNFSKIPKGQFDKLVLEKTKTLLCKPTKSTISDIGTIEQLIKHTRQKITII